MIACKFFNDHRKICWWANEKKSHIDIISVTFVPRGGWCVFFEDKESSKNIIKEDYDDTDDKISYNEIVNG